jgi:hypothetical protein
MLTKPALDFDAIDAAEDAHVEACTGDQIRAALAPYVPYLRGVHPDGARGLLTGFGATGDDWIAFFRAPTRFGWTGKRYTKPVAAQIVALLAQLDDLQANCALAYRKTQETL